jgi:hypothetical protein
MPPPGHVRKLLPQPRPSDIQHFCEIDGWEETKGATGKRGNHRRFRKTLDDGRILRTRVSHGDDEIGDPSLWRHIWRDQLEIESEEIFWEVLANGEPVDRSPASPQPSVPSLPGWLVNKLIRNVGLAPEEVAAMSEQEAHERLNEFYSQPRE